MSGPETGNYEPLVKVEAVEGEVDNLKFDEDAFNDMYESISPDQLRKALDYKLSDIKNNFDSGTFDLTGDLKDSTLEESMVMKELASKINRYINDENISGNDLLLKVGNIDTNGIISRVLQGTESKKLSGKIGDGGKRVKSTYNDIRKMTGEIG